MNVGPSKGSKPPSQSQKAKDLGKEKKHETAYERLYGKMLEKRKAEAKAAEEKTQESLTKRKRSKQAEAPEEGNLN